jgi:hypothetical protein
MPPHLASHHHYGLHRPCPPSTTRMPSSSNCMAASLSRNRQMSPVFASFVQVSHLHFHGMFLTRSDYDRGLPAAASTASIHLTRAALQVSTLFHQRAVCFRLSAAKRCLQRSLGVVDVFFQVEYALEAIKLGSTSIGIQTAEVPITHSFLSFELTSAIHIAVLNTVVSTHCAHLGCCIGCREAYHVAAVGVLLR